MTEGATGEQAATGLLSHYVLNRSLYNISTVSPTINNVQMDGVKSESHTHVIMEQNRACNAAPMKLTHDFMSPCVPIIALKQQLQ